MVLGIQGIRAFLPLKARTWNGGTYGTDHSDKNVTKTFIGKDNQVEALKGISLDINKGDIYGIIGMSGAGKSTLVRCLNYLEKPTTGTVVVEDQDLSTLTEAELRKVRTGIAMIFQHFNLLRAGSVQGNERRRRHHRQDNGNIRVYRKQSQRVHHYAERHI